MMKLFYSPTSPYARKVRMVAIETGQDAYIETISVNVAQEQPELFAANPLGKVPSLVLANGEALFDSPVICHYLDSLSGHTLLPQSGWQHWEILRWEALADGLMDAAYNRVMEERSRPECERSPAAMTRWENEITRTLQHLETRFDTLGASLTLAHLALGAAIGYLEFRLPHLLHSAACPQTLAWYAQFHARPAMRATQPA